MKLVIHAKQGIIKNRNYAIFVLRIALYAKIINFAQNALKVPGLLKTSLKSSFVFWKYFLVFVYFINRGEITVRTQKINVKKENIGIQIK